MRENIRTILADLPTTIGGYTIRKDDYYTIILNENLSHQDNLDAYAHELEHILKGDFESKNPVGLIEIYSH